MEHKELITEFGRLEVSFNQRSSKAIGPETKYIRIRNTNQNPRGDWVTIEELELKELVFILKNL